MLRGARSLSLAVCDYNNQVVCDLYDNQSDVSGQATDVFVRTERNGWKELSFKIPSICHTDEGGEENYRLQYLIADYRIRLKTGFMSDDGEVTQTDYYLISEPRITHNGKAKNVEVVAGHISQLLKTKNLNLEFSDDEGNNVGTAEQILTTILDGTGWTVGNVAEFLEDDGQTVKVRSLVASAKTGAFALISNMCEKFDAKPIYHGDTRTVDIVPMNPFSEVEGAEIPQEVLNGKNVIELNYGRNISNISRTLNTENLVTRLYAYGAYGDKTNGLCSLQTVNHNEYKMSLNIVYPAEKELFFFDANQVKHYFMLTHDTEGSNSLVWSDMDPLSMSYVFNESKNEVYDVYSEAQTSSPTQLTAAKTTVKNRLDYVMDFSYYNDIGLLTDDMKLALALHQRNMPSIIEESTEAARNLLLSESELSKVAENNTGYLKLDIASYGTGTNGELVLNLRKSTYPTGVIYRSDYDEARRNYFSWYCASGLKENGDPISGIGSVLYIIHKTNPVTWEKAYVKEIDGESKTQDYSMYNATNPSSITLWISKSKVPNLQSTDRFYLFSTNSISGQLGVRESEIESLQQTLDQTTKVVTEKHPTYFIWDEEPAPSINNVQNGYGWYYRAYSSGFTGARNDGGLHFCYGIAGETAWHYVYVSETIPSAVNDAYYYNLRNKKVYHGENSEWIDLAASGITVNSTEYVAPKTEASRLSQSFSKVYYYCRRHDMLYEGLYEKYTYTPPTELGVGNYAIQSDYGFYWVFSTTQAIPARKNIWLDTQKYLVYQDDDVANIVTPETKPYETIDFPAANELADAFFADGTLSNEGGTETEDIRYKRSNYIPVYGGIRYDYHLESECKICFYDSNKRFIHTWRDTNRTNQTTDTKAKYMRWVIPSSETFDINSVYFRVYNYQWRLFIKDTQYIILQNVTHSGDKLGIHMLVNKFANISDECYSNYLKVFQNKQAAILAADNSLKNTLQDLYREGYWQKNEYVEGDEEKLYKDALENLKKISKPEATYSFDYLDLYSANKGVGYSVAEDLEEVEWPDIDITDAVHLIDEEIDVNCWAFIDRLEKCYDQPWKTTLVVNTNLSLIAQHSFTDVLARIAEVANETNAKQTIYKRAAAISSAGVYAANKLEGTIKANNILFQGGSSNWHTDAKGNFVFESADGQSAMMLTGYGFCVSNSRDADGDWIWRTFGTGNGFTADEIVAGEMSAERLIAGTITTDKLSAAVGQELEISSNKSLTLFATTDGSRPAGSLKTQRLNEDGSYSPVGKNDSYIQIAAAQGNEPAHIDIMTGGELRIEASQMKFIVPEETGTGTTYKSQQDYIDEQIIETVRVYQANNTPGDATEKPDADITWTTYIPTMSSNGKYLWSAIRTKNNKDEYAYSEAIYETSLSSKVKETIRVYKIHTKNDTAPSRPDDGSEDTEWKTFIPAVNGTYKYLWSCIRALEENGTYTYGTPVYEADLSLKIKEIYKEYCVTENDAKTKEPVNPDTLDPPDQPVWSKTIPTKADDTYTIWWRLVTVYTNGTSTHGDAQKDDGLNGLSNAAITAVNIASGDIGVPHVKTTGLEINKDGSINMLSTSKITVAANKELWLGTKDDEYNNGIVFNKDGISIGSNKTIAIAASQLQFVAANSNSKTYEEYLKEQIVETVKVYNRGTSKTTKPQPPTGKSTTANVNWTTDVPAFATGSEYIWSTTRYKDYEGYYTYDQDAKYEADLSSKLKETIRVYKTGDSKMTAPEITQTPSGSEDTSWKTYIPSVTNEYQYLWSCIRELQQDGTYTYGTPIYEASLSTKVKETVRVYQTSTKNSSSPPVTQTNGSEDTNWTLNVPAVDETNKYLWSCVRLKYENDTYSYGTPILETDLSLKIKEVYKEYCITEPDKTPDEYETDEEIALIPWGKAIPKRKIENEGTNNERIFDTIYYRLVTVYTNGDINTGEPQKDLGLTELTEAAKTARNIASGAEAVKKVETTGITIDENKIEVGSTGKLWLLGNSEVMVGTSSSNSAMIMNKDGISIGSEQSIAIASGGELQLAASSLKFIVTDEQGKPVTDEQGRIKTKSYDEYVAENYNLENDIVESVCVYILSGEWEAAKKPVPPTGKIKPSDDGFSDWTVTIPNVENETGKKYIWSAIRYKHADGTYSYSSSSQWEGGLATKVARTYKQYCLTESDKSPYLNTVEGHEIDGYSETDRAKYITWSQYIPKKKTVDGKDFDTIWWRIVTILTNGTVKYGDEYTKDARLTALSDAAITATNIANGTLGVPHVTTTGIDISNDGIEMLAAKKLTVASGKELWIGTSDKEGKINAIIFNESGMSVGSNKSIAIAANKLEFLVPNSDNKTYQDYLDEEIIETVRVYKRHNVDNSNEDETGPDYTPDNKGFDSTWYATIPEANTALPYIWGRTRTKYKNGEYVYSVASYEKNLTTKVSRTYKEYCVTKNQNGSYVEPGNDATWSTQIPTTDENGQTVDKLTHTIWWRYAQRYVNGKYNYGDVYRVTDSTRLSDPTLRAYYISKGYEAVPHVESSGLSINGDMVKLKSTGQLQILGNAQVYVGTSSSNSAVILDQHGITIGSGGTLTVSAANLKFSTTKSYQDYLDDEITETVRVYKLWGTTTAPDTPPRDGTQYTDETHNGYTGATNGGWTYSIPNVTDEAEKKYLFSALRYKHGTGANAYYTYSSSCQREANLDTKVKATYCEHCVTEGTDKSPRIYTGNDAKYITWTKAIPLRKTVKDQTTNKDRYFNTIWLRFVTEYTNGTITQSTPVVYYKMNALDNAAITAENIANGTEGVPYVSSDGITIQNGDINITSTACLTIAANQKLVIGTNNANDTNNAIIFNEDGISIGSNKSIAIAATNLKLTSTKSFKDYLDEEIVESVRVYTLSGQWETTKKPVPPNRTLSGEQYTENNWTVTMPNVTTENDKKYVWGATRYKKRDGNFTYSDSSYEGNLTTKVARTYKAYKVTDNDANNNPVQPLSTSTGWTEAIPQKTGNQTIWSRIVTVYTNGTEKTLNPGAITEETELSSYSNAAITAENIVNGTVGVPHVLTTGLEIKKDGSIEMLAKRKITVASGKELWIGTSAIGENNAIIFNEDGISVGSSKTIAIAAEKLKIFTTTPSDGKSYQDYLDNEVVETVRVYKLHTDNKNSGITGAGPVLTQTNGTAIDTTWTATIPEATTTSPYVWGRTRTKKKNGTYSYSLATCEYNLTNKVIETYNEYCVTENKNITDSTNGTPHNPDDADIKDNVTWTTTIPDRPAKWTLWFRTVTKQKNGLLTKTSSQQATTTAAKNDPALRAYNIAKGYEAAGRITTTGIDIRNGAIEMLANTKIMVAAEKELWIGTTAIGRENAIIFTEGGISIGSKKNIAIAAGGKVQIGSATSMFTFGATTTDGYMYNGMTSLNDTEHNGVYVGTNGIALGKGAFKVTKTGALTATSATIKGNITASTLKIEYVHKETDKEDVTKTSTITLDNDGKIQLGSIANGTNLAAFTVDSNNVSTLVWDTASQSASTVTIASNKISLASTGNLEITSGNFAIDKDGNVTMTGKITSTSGAIGGWNIASNKLYSGVIKSQTQSQTTYYDNSYIALSSDTTGYNTTNSVYAMWVGAVNPAEAPFSVKRDGSVYLKSLYVKSGNSSSKINLFNYGLLGTDDINVSADGITFKGTYYPFKTAASVTAGWSGAALKVYVKDKNNNTLLDQEVASIDFSKTEANVKNAFDGNNKQTISIDDETNGWTVKTITLDATGAYNRGAKSGWNDCIDNCSSGEYYDSSEGPHQIMTDDGESIMAITSYRKVTRYTIPNKK